MSEPAPKRRRVVPSTTTTTPQILPFSILPEEVIVIEIMSHVQLYTYKSIWAKETNEAMRFMGRFTKNILRQPWMLQRNVIISTRDILGAVGKSRQVVTNLSEANLPSSEIDEIAKQAIAKFLPAMIHENIKKYTTRLQISSLDMHIDRLTHYINKYENITRLNRWSPSSREDWPTMNREDFEIHLRRVVTVLFSPKMPQLEVINADMWMLKTLTGVQDRLSDKFNTVDFSDTGTIYFPDLIRMQDPRITKLIEIGLMAKNELIVLERFFEIFTLYPNLTCLNIRRWLTFFPIRPIGNEFATLLNSRRKPFTVLHLPEAFRMDARFIGWTRKIVNELTISNYVFGDLPEFSNTLKTLHLRTYKIPNPYFPPANVTFTDCWFCDLASLTHEIELVGRVNRATFRGSCHFETADPTVHSATIEKLILDCRVWLGEILGPASLTLNMPNLKRAVLDIHSHEVDVTIISDNALDSLRIYFRHPNLQSRNYHLKSGVKTLTLVGGFPILDGALHLVEHLYLIQPPRLSTLSKRTDYSNMANIAVLHVVEHNRFDTEQYRAAFNAGKVEFEEEE